MINVSYLNRRHRFKVLLLCALRGIELGQNKKLVCLGEREMFRCGLLYNGCFVFIYSVSIRTTQQNLVSSGIELSLSPLNKN